jgi:hypothetical protein
VYEELAKAESELEVKQDLAVLSRTYVYVAR